MPDLQTLKQLSEDVGAASALMLMGVFKDDVDPRIAFIRGYLANGGDLKELRLHAHSLKGLCRTYGATTSGDLAMELQEACDSGDAAQIRDKAQAALDTIPADVEAAITAMTTLAAKNAET